MRLHQGGDHGHGSGIEYEVTLTVPDALVPAYLAWLQAHVRQMLALPGFLGASLWRVEEPASAGAAIYCVRYQLRDARALDAYLRRHAAAMRQAGLARFGTQVQAARRILRPLP